MADWEHPWFAEKRGSLWVFRVNRRPVSKPTLLTPDIPADVFDHFMRMLTPGYAVKTGRSNQRRWRVGGVSLDHDQRMLTAKLGWQSLGGEPVPEWSEEENDWITSNTTAKGGRVVPLGFDAETRLLAVLRDPSTSAHTVASVIEQILRDNERELEDPSTEWSVEPVLNLTDFLSWVESVDTLQLVSFTAKLPNPSPDPGFQEIFERMEARRATLYREELRSNTDEGLVGIEDDEEIRQAIAMGERGFATLRGQGRRDGRKVQYSQTERVAREDIEEVPATWDEVFATIKSYLRGVLPKLLNQTPPPEARLPELERAQSSEETERDAS